MKSKKILKMTVKELLGMIYDLSEHRKHSHKPHKAAPHDARKKQSTRATR
ncbi:MAG: hypothetical protein PSY14_16410 [bacterium]|nr:hypothetical protein [bacterium]